MKLSFWAKRYIRSLRCLLCVLRSRLRVTLDVAATEFKITGFGYGSALGWCVRCSALCILSCFSVMTCKYCVTIWQMAAPVNAHLIQEQRVFFTSHIFRCFFSAVDGSLGDSGWRCSGTYDFCALLIREDRNLGNDSRSATHC